jgi:hypothetical protein
MNTPDQPIHTEIDDVAYICLVQAAIPANQSLIKLMGVISAPTISLLSGAVRGFAMEDGELTVAGLGNMDFVTGLTMLFSELTPDAATVILQEGFRGIATPDMKAAGKDLSDEAVLNEHFRGHLLRMYKVFAWSLGCNYRDFLDVASQVNLSNLTHLASKLKSSKQSKTDTQNSQPSTSPTATVQSSGLSASAIQ